MPNRYLHLLAALLTTLAITLLLAPPAATAPGLDFSALIAAARVKGPLDYCGERVPMEDPDVRERMEREMLSVLADPHQVILWIKRSRQALAPIEAALRVHGLPQDLKYVAIAESDAELEPGPPYHVAVYFVVDETTPGCRTNSAKPMPIGSRYMSSAACRSSP